jgi:hypothetical protein
VAGDPIGSHLVSSLARPGGNVTGLSNAGSGLAAQRLELLRDVVPELRQLAVMANVDYSGGLMESDEIEAAARTLHVEIISLPIRRKEDIAPAFARRAPAHHVPATGVRRSGWTDVLWHELHGPPNRNDRLILKDTPTRDSVNQLLVTSVFGSIVFADCAKGGRTVY